MAKKKKEPKGLKTLKDLDEAGIEYEVVETISQKAQNKFWEEVEKLCPEATTKDQDNVSAFQFNMMCDNVVHKWREKNDKSYKSIK